MKSKHILMFVFAVLMGVGVAGCKKSKLNKETTTDEDNSVAEVMFSQVDDEADNAIAELESIHFNSNNSGAWKGMDSCAIVTYTLSSDSTYISSVVIDFGNGCTNPNNGRVRKGIIRINQTGKRLMVGTVRTITFDNFSINDYKIEGTKTITTSTVNFNTWIFQFNVKVVGGKITSPQNEVVTWDSERVREIALSGGQIYVRILAGGTMNGVNRAGRSYVATIDQTMERLLSCRWFTKGIVKIEPDDLNIRTIDFGDGTCDNKAKVTVKKKEFEITLK